MQTNHDFIRVLISLISTSFECFYLPTKQQCFSNINMHMNYLGLGSKAEAGSVGGRHGFRLACPSNSLPCDADSAGPLRTLISKALETTQKHQIRTQLQRPTTQQGLLIISSGSFSHFLSPLFSSIVHSLPNSPHFVIPCYHLSACDVLCSC